MKDLKYTIKIANQIQKALARLQKRRLIESQQRLQNFTEKFKELDTEANRLGLAISKNWLNAAEKKCNRINSLFCDLNYSISRIKDTIKRPKLEIPSLRVLLADLKQIEDDLGGFQYESNRNTLSVTTESISLEGIYLGPFKIELQIEKLEDLYKQPCYYVIALNPNPAATDNSVTHPHVSGEQLCEGDGAVTIRKSLEEGRLCDFFSMVENILKVYNPDSPFVSLDDWEGITCYDCGYVMSEDNTCFCHFCERDYCEECTLFCPCCQENTCCLGCSTECQFCCEVVCPECFTKCMNCGTTCCLRCIEEDLCPDCINERKQDYEKQRQKEAEQRQDSESKLEAAKAELKITG